MQRSKVENFHHLVWATDKRHNFLESAIERAVYRYIRAEVARFDCQVLGLNGMPDHTHLVVKVHSTVAIAILAKAIKGHSSRLANEKLGFEGAFAWQDCYASFSLSRNHLARAIRYVERQKIHHASGKVWDEWEETEMEVDL